MNIIIRKIPYLIIFLLFHGAVSGQTDDDMRLSISADVQYPYYFLNSLKSQSIDHDYWKQEFKNSFNHGESISINYQVTRVKFSLGLMYSTKNYSRPYNERFDSILSSNIYTRTDLLNLPVNLTVFLLKNKKHNLGISAGCMFGRFLHTKEIIETPSKKKEINSAAQYFYGKGGYSAMQLGLTYCWSIGENLTVNISLGSAYQLNKLLETDGFLYGQHTYRPALNDRTQLFGKMGIEYTFFRKNNE